MPRKDTSRVCCLLIQEPCQTILYKICASPWLEGCKCKNHAKRLAPPSAINMPGFGLSSKAIVIPENIASLMPLD